MEWEILSPVLPMDALREACVQARRYRIGVVCVAPYYVGIAADTLRGAGVAVSATIGEPGTLMSTEAKVAEVKKCLLDGADELSVATNMMAVKSGRIADIRDELSQIADIAAGKAVVKISIEAALFEEEEKLKMLSLIKESGAGYVELRNRLKDQGADEEDIEFAKYYLGNSVGIKGNGAYHTPARIKEILSAGADRIGLSDAISIVRAIEESSL